MLKKQKLGLYRALLLIVVLPILLAQGLNFQALAQDIEPAFQGDKNFLRIGRLWSSLEGTPGEGWNSTWAWPGGEFLYYGKESHPTESYGSSSKKLGGAIGVTDWTDPLGGSHPYWTSEGYRHGGTLAEESDWKVDEMVSIPACEQWQYMRFPPPQVIVEGVETIAVANELWTEMTNGRIDENLVTDKANLARWLYTMGVECERWTYAWSTPKEQDIIYTDYTLKNTGVPDYTSWVRGNVPLQGQTLHNLKWSQVNQSPIFKLGRDDYGDDDIGELIYPWPNIDRPFALIYDGDGDRVAAPDWGDPNVSAARSKWGWRLLSPGYFVNGVIHADAAHDNTADDYTQPSDVHFAGEKVDCFVCVNGDATHKTNHEIIWRGRSDPGVLHNRNDPEISKGGSFVTSYIGVGPYEMPFGSDIHISHVWVMSGLSFAEAGRIGRDIYNNGNSRNQTQEEIDLIATGRDSVLKALDRAYWVYHGVYPDGSNPKPAEYNQPYNVPDPPRPPAILTVGAKGAAIELTWTDEAEITPDWDTRNIDFAGYRIYRAIGGRDSTYHLIEDISGSASSYLDPDVIVGIAYFYYLVAYDNGNENWEEPGKQLESGRFHCWTGWNQTPVIPALAGITSPSELDNIRVVPNPHNVSGLTYPGASETEANKINFMNVPGKCTIKIYTTGGTLIHTIDHDDGSRIAAWSLRTEFNQYPTSDVYIYVVDSDLGTRVGKFVIIR